MTGAVTSRRSIAVMYFAAEGFSYFGSATMIVVLPWLVFARTGNPALAGTIATIVAIPSAITAFAAGPIVDRFGRRRTAVVASIGRAISIIVMMVIDLGDGLTITWFIVLGVLGAALDAPGMTGRDSLVADVAESARVGVDSVAGGRQAVYGVTYVAGPGVAGILLVAFSPEVVLAIAAMFPAMAAVLTMILPITERFEGLDEGGSGSVSAYRLAREDLTYRGVLVVGFGVQFVALPLINIVLPAVFSGDDRADLLGWTAATYAIGIALGSLVYVGLRRRFPRLVFVASAVFLGAGLLLMSTLRGFPAIAGGVGLAGLGGGMLLPYLNVYMNTRMASNARGRVIGLFNAASLSAGPVGLAITSVIVATLGGVPAGAVFIGVCGALLGIYGISSPALARCARAEPAAVSEDSVSTSDV